MWGWGILICPAISGVLSEPIRQYPHLFNDEESRLYRFLDSYPFFLPNLVGALLCLVCMVLVHFFVPETLPEHLIRDASHLPSDILSPIRNLIPNVFSSGVAGSRILVNRGEGGGHAHYGAIDESDDNCDVADLPLEILALVQEDVEDAIRESILSYDEEPTLFSEKGRRSLSDSVVKQASFDMLMNKPSRQQLSEMSVDPQRQQATIQSLWARVTTRNHMIVYWYVCDPSCFK
jgi:hypothetical protein